MNEWLKKIAEFVVSCGINFHLPLSTVWGSMLAFPMLLIFRLLGNPLGNLVLKGCFCCNLGIGCFEQGYEV